MKASTLLRANISLNSYIMKYGPMVAPVVIRAIIALDKVHRIKVTKQEAYSLSNDYSFNKSTPKGNLIVYNFIADKLNEHYGESPYFPKLTINAQKHELYFILSELCFHGHIKEESIREQYTRIVNTYHKSYSKLLANMSIVPLEMLTLVNLNLTDSELYAYLETYDEDAHIQDEVETSKGYISYYMFN